MIAMNAANPGVGVKKVAATVILALALTASLLYAPTFAAGTDAKPSLIAEIVPDALQGPIAIDSADAGFWGCAGAIASFIVGNAFIYSKVLKLGGAVKTARKVRQAIKAIKRYGHAWNSGAAFDIIVSVGGYALAEILGVSSIRRNCW